MYVQVLTIKYPLMNADAMLPHIKSRMLYSSRLAKILKEKFRLVNKNYLELIHI